MNDYDVTGPVQDAYTEELIALGLTGGPFTEHDAGKLAGGDTHYWLLVSAFRRKDRRAVRIFLADWRQQTTRPLTVSKFVPGSHYHCDGHKFKTLADAQAYIRRVGRSYGGLREQFVYPENP